MGDIHAVSVVAYQGERFLLVKRGHAPSIGKYAFPGGKVEPGESSEQAARRELMEETNLSAGALTLLQSMILDGDNEKRYSLKIFQTDHAEGNLQAGDDASLAGWYSVQEMRALPVTESSLTVAAQVLIAAKSEKSLVEDTIPGTITE